MTGTDPEQLRQSITRATLPLLGEYETLTTARIAEAAGIGEADLLAVFADKEAVMQACVASMTETVTALLDPARELRELAVIPTDQPLASRLVKVIDILDAHSRRVRDALDDLAHPGAPADAGPADASPADAGPADAGPADAGPGRSGRPDDAGSLAGSYEFRQAVAKLLEPDEHRLRLPAPILAQAFIGMTFGGIRPVGPDQSPLAAAEVVDLFLHGALHTD